jgi:hypothetical protein
MCFCTFLPEPDRADDVVRVLPNLWLAQFVIPTEASGGPMSEALANGKLTKNWGTDGTIPLSVTFVDRSFSRMEERSPSIQTG